MIGFARLLLRVSFVLAVSFLHQGFLFADDQPAVDKPNVDKPAAEKAISEKVIPQKAEGVATPTSISGILHEPGKVQELAASVKKSVVVVTFNGRDGQQQGLGSGFVISSDGLIATNLHVIGEARPIRVELYDGRKFDVTSVWATERSQDLAILKIDAKDLPPLTLGDSEQLQEGQPVIAVGNPLGLERSVVVGVLSGRREIEGRKMLQIALPIERGNSGGPLLDFQGRVHGLLTLKSLKTENLGFAIQSNSLKPLLEKPNPIPMSRWLTIGVLDPDEWTALPGGNWRQRAGQISVDGRGRGFGDRALCLAKETPPEVPFEVAVQVKFTPEDGAAGLVFHSDGGDKHFGFYPSSGNIRLSRFDGPDVYSWNVLRETRAAGFKRDGWNALKVRVEADRLLCYLNQELIFEVTDSTYTSGKVGLCKFRHSQAEFKGFRIGKTLLESRPADGSAERVLKMLEGLTSDDSSSVAAIEHLSKDEASVVDTIEQQAKSLEKQAARLRRLVTDVHTKKTLSELQAAMKNDSVNLLTAALLLAKLDNPELDIPAYVQQVERHAKRAKLGVNDEASEEQRFVALNRYLFEEQGFHGSRTDYGHPSNSYINEVLDDREGLPITLSVLYIELAKQIGLNVVGVGMPSHFLVRHEPANGDPQLLDVFDRGRPLTPAEARTIFEEFSNEAWVDTNLNTIPSAAIVERMLRNLFNAATESPDPERLLRYTQAILIVKPDSATDHFRSGVLCYQTQRWQQAKSEVEWLTNHDSNISRDTIEGLARAIARESQK